ncbi:uncharacterized abhydrolase domain-containing protein DDB_G0269086-like [Rana temporaria]|uniref:uncharacterized abhydrolase domain-containing protein DDB_G0269086-like n=1 Tax=Rana temporaria TaxID=8407 RepID=UPI001AACFEDB|nr:uncharacterized abhydrolase domain-containing protein DDB_G0269086-like [Rana temporaria]
MSELYKRKITTNVSYLWVLQEMSAKDDQMKKMENSYTECMKALKDKEEADKKEKETWKKELEEKLGIVQKEWEEKSERNGVALQEQCKEANEKQRNMEEQLMKMMEELKVMKEQHEKEKEMEEQMDNMMEAMEQKMKAGRDRAERDRAKKDQDEKDQAEKDRTKKDQDEKDRVKKDRAKKNQNEKDRAKKDQNEKDQAEKDRAKKDQNEKDRAKKDQDEKAQDEKMMTESDLQKQKFALSFMQMKDLEPGALPRLMEERSKETLQPVKLQPLHVKVAADLLTAKITFESCPCCKFGVSQTKAINTSEIFDLLCPSCYSLMKKLSSAQIMEVCKFCPWCGHTASRRRPTKTVGIPDLLCSDCHTLMDKLRSGRTMDISDLPCSACPLLQPLPNQEIKMTPNPPSGRKPTIMGERVARLHSAKKLATGQATDAQKIYKTTTLESPSIIAPLKTKPTIIAPLKTKPTIITPLKTKPTIITPLKKNLQLLPKRKTTISLRLPWISVEDQSSSHNSR